MLDGASWNNNSFDLAHIMAVFHTVIQQPADIALFMVIPDTDSKNLSRRVLTVIDVVLELQITEGRTSLDNVFY